MLVRVPMVDAFCDESADQEQKRLLCVCAVVAHENFWKRLEAEWTKTLDRYGVKYFSAKECKAVQGPFKHLLRECGSLEAAKEKAKCIRDELEDILVPRPELPPAQWHGFALAVVIPEYEYVWQAVPEARRFYAKDPTVAAYQQVMYEVVRVVRRKLKGWGVAYIIDQSNDSPKILHAFQAMKVHHPMCGKSAKTCAPFDDKETPGLQMADLFASSMRERFEEWLTSGKVHPTFGKWIRNTAESKLGLWNAAFMLKSLMRALEHPRYKRGELVPQLPPGKRALRRQKRILKEERSKNENAQIKTPKGNTP